MNQPLIAVVDDDDHVRDATASVLRSMDYETRKFASAAALLEADMSDVDCVLSDYQMPGMSGLQLLQTLRAQGSAVPLIIMTAFTSDGIADRALKLGAVGFLEKPIDDAALVRIMTEALGAR